MKKKPPASGYYFFFIYYYSSENQRDYTEEILSILQTPTTYVILLLNMWRLEIFIYPFKIIIYLAVVEEKKNKQQHNLCACPFSRTQNNAHPYSRM